MNADCAKVTIAIPTYNRADLLARSLRSAMEQDYSDIKIMVLDNASNDDTYEVVNSCNDSRIHYLRHQYNIGLFANFRYALSHCTSPFIVILQDDDILYPAFVSTCLDSLQSNPGAAMAACRMQAIDLHNRLIPLPEDPGPQGIISGTDYLHNMVAGRNWVIHMSGVLMRMDCAVAAGGFDNTHSAYNIDLNLYFRMASRHDLSFIPDILAAVRLHEGQETNTQFRIRQGLGQLVTLADRSDAAALLLQSDNACSKSYREWLGNRLLDLGARRSALSSKLVPGLNLDQDQVLKLLIEELEQEIPQGCPFALIDQAIWIDQLPPERPAIPFPESGGVYNGLPADDRSAISELHRLSESGVRYLVVVQAAFWWLDYYCGLDKFIQENCRCRLKNSRVIIFEWIA